MTHQDNDQQKITDLEMRIAFQEEAIDALNEQLSKQALELEKLSRIVALLNKNMKSLGEGQFSTTNDNQPPPHY